jgi:hypothetical protein
MPCAQSPHWSPPKGDANRRGRMTRTRTAVFALMTSIASIGSATSVLALAAGPFAAVEHCPLAARPVSSEAAAIDLAAHAVQTYRLTQFPLECLSFSADRDTKLPGYTVDVRKSSAEKCNGDPDIAPRLLSISIRKDGQMTTDSYDHENFKPLVCPIASRHVGPTKG